mgnify:CR=1 FL=1
MKNSLFYICLISLFIGSSQSIEIPVDTIVTTTHYTTVKGVKFEYTAETGMQPVWDKDGLPIASLFYTYYTRNNIKNRATRPLIISFNGGPGSASVWMHIAYTGPRILNVDSEGYPVQPYGFKNNPNSILDEADIVFVNPVNTGYSRMLPNKEGEMPDREEFFGINEDIKYLAEWINTFVSRKNRWESPKYIIGESYGGTRVMGLSLELQQNQWMYLNGVVLVSPTDLGIKREGPVAAALYVPYFAATAWYHKALPADLQQKDLTDYLPEVEKFTIDELLPAITKGGSLDPAKRKAIAATYARYTGLSEQTILDHNFEISTNFFWKELLRDRGFTIGRLDSRYLGIDRQNAGEGPDYNAELSSWEHSFMPAMNIYLRDELNYKTDLTYYLFGPVRPWDRTQDNTGYNLGKAMAENPYLKVLVQSGYYDGACDYFNAKYNLWQIDPSGKFKDRMSWEGYRSGHMMYLRKEDLATSNENLRIFIKNAIPKAGTPAKYQERK